MNFIRNRLYDSTQIDFDHLLFPNKALRALLIPLILEQFLNSLMGMLDTMMVTRYGDAALSAVSSVDAVNNFIMNIFSALAAGAVIICSQYAGKHDEKKCNLAAGQIVMTVSVISLLVTAVCIVFRDPLLRLLFGQVERTVMENARSYFSITALSYPFFALFSAGSAFLRAGGNSRYPMVVSALSNVLHILINFILIFGFDLGARGAALSTLLSRIFCMVVIFIHLRKPGQLIVVRKYMIKPVFAIIGTILAIGVPAGIENGMFYFGKLAIQSTIATLSPSQMAAQAMTNTMESFTSMAGTGIGLGLMTVVGQALGAGRQEEARYYIVKFTLISQIAVTLSCIAIYFVGPLATRLSSMAAESAALCLRMNTVHVIIKSLLWALAFTPVNGMRAAGDVKYNMVVSTLIMWVLRVALCVYLIRFRGMGISAAWIALAADWVVRAGMMTHRYLSKKWIDHTVI